MQQERRPNGDNRSRHWWYESDEAAPFPHFMNDGYAPPDWELLVALEMTSSLNEEDGI